MKLKQIKSDLTSIRTMYLLCQQSAIYHKLPSHEISLYKEYNLILAGKNWEKWLKLTPSEKCSSNTPLRDSLVRFSEFQKDWGTRSSKNENIWGHSNVNYTGCASGMTPLLNWPVWNLLTTYFSMTLFFEMFNTWPPFYFKDMYSMTPIFISKSCIQWPPFLFHFIYLFGLFVSFMCLFIVNGIMNWIYGLIHVQVWPRVLHL